MNRLVLFILIASLGCLLRKFLAGAAVGVPIWTVHGDGAFDLSFGGVKLGGWYSAFDVKMRKWS